MARLGSVALLALGLTRFLAAGDAQSRAACGLAGGMVLYDIGAVAILLYAALGLGLTGVLLWPAALLHLAMAVWGMLLLARKPAQPPVTPQAG
jgi:hypothetical protein